MTQSPLRRREYLLAASAVIGGSSMAGCVDGENSEDDGPGSQEDEDSSGEDQSGEKKTESPTIESFSASDIRVGNDGQRIRIRLSHVEPGEEVEVYVDASSLIEANIEVGDLGVRADTGIGSLGWSVIDADLTTDEEVLISVTATVEKRENLDEIGTVEIELTGLDTTGAEHTSDLRHEGTVTTTDGGPDFSDGKGDTYDVIDPDELENLLRVRPSDMRIGEDSQDVDITINHSTDEIEFRLDLAPVTEVGVSVENADLVVEEAAGERRNDEGVVEIEVTDAAVVEGVARLNITTTADTLAVNTRITGLGTENAEPTDEITYPVYTGERPPEPTESRQFSISGAVA